MLETGWRNIIVKLPSKPPVFMVSERVIDAYIHTYIYTYIHTYLI